MAALPGRHTDAIWELLADIYPSMERAESVEFLFYEEGVSIATERLIEALYKERIAIGVKLGIAKRSAAELSGL